MVAFVLVFPKAYTKKLTASWSMGGRGFRWVRWRNGDSDGRERRILLLLTSATSFTSCLSVSSLTLSWTYLYCSNFAFAVISWFSGCILEVAFGDKQTLSLIWSGASHDVSVYSTESKHCYRKWVSFLPCSYFQKRYRGSCYWWEPTVLTKTWGNYFLKFYCKVKILMWIT